MKANIYFKTLKKESCTETILERISSIKDLSEIEINADATSISFKYHSDEAALSLVEKLNNLGCAVMPQRRNRAKPGNLVS